MFNALVCWWSGHIPVRREVQYSQVVYGAQGVSYVPAPSRYHVHCGRCGEHLRIEDQVFAAARDDRPNIILPG